MLIAVCSLKGSPGVTTLASALGARWPGGQSPIVVEADPAGGDLMARFRLSDTPGLVSLAAAARRRGGTDPNLVTQHTQVLNGGLRVIIGPVGAEQARAALSVLAPGPASLLRRAADQPGITIIADCGRVDPDSPALAIIRAADTMLLVARPHDDELAHVALKLQAAQQWSRRPCLVLVGDGYSTAEVSQILRIPVMARVPSDIRGAAALCGQVLNRRSPDKCVLSRAAATIALNIHANSQQPAAIGTRAPQLRLAHPDALPPNVFVHPRSSTAGNGVAAP
ncbi:chromosome partitioning protein [Lentzea sp. NPDC004782]|uniref:chromosome partitioning protein n=1 Tax=Lentzea sp. NPDC004782 TaxID=3154458 RepID=UPI0033A7A296